MTITLRLQFKGDVARHLSLEDRDKGVPRHDLARTLSHFLLPTPDSTKVVGKSGFILCNYNTTTESRLYEHIERGARRAQSLGFKTTMENLSISYVHLFENSKPIHLGSKTQKPEYTPKHFTPYTHRPHRRSLSPSSDTVRGRRPLYPNRTWTASGAHSAASTSASIKQSTSEQSAEPTPERQSQAESAERFLATVPKPEELSGSAPRVNGGSDTLQVAQETLRALSASAPLKALLENPLEDLRELSVKREEGLISPRRLLAPPIEYKILGSSRNNIASTDSSPNISTNPFSLSPRVARDQHASGNAFSRRTKRTFSFEWKNKSDWDVEKEKSAVIIESPPRTFKPFTRHLPGRDEVQKQHTELKDRVGPPLSSPAFKPWARSYGYHARSDNKGETRPYTSRSARSASPPSRNVKIYPRPGWTATVTSKRPLSPEPVFRQSASPPPLKRRLLPLYSSHEQSSRLDHMPDSGLIPGSELSLASRLDPPNGEKQIPTGPKALLKRMPDSPNGSTLFQSPMSRKTFLPKDRTEMQVSTNDLLKSNNTSTAIAVTANTPMQRSQTMALIRELWDVRRQAAALKARETTIRDELKQAGALVPNDNSTVTHVQAQTQTQAQPQPQPQSLPEERIKSLQTEIALLRNRLQKETALRKLAEESCETERRRRKLAEGMLDDARREQSTPLVVPAMMDAFQRIAQLTGDALMVDD